VEKNNKRSFLDHRNFKKTLTQNSKTPKTSKKI
jgi:hypothetical protein